MLDVDVGLAFELQYQLADAADAALGFQQYAPVGQVARPAGQIQLFCQVISRVAKAHVLHFAGKNDSPSRLRSFHGLPSMQQFRPGMTPGGKMIVLC